MFFEQPKKDTCNKRRRPELRGVHPEMAGVDLVNPMDCQADSAARNASDSSFTRVAHGKCTRKADGTIPSKSKGMTKPGSHACDRLSTATLTATKKRTLSLFASWWIPSPTI